MNTDLQAYTPDDHEEGKTEHEILFASLSNKQQQFIVLMRQCFGNIVTACRNMQPKPIHRTTYYWWLKNNPNFAAVIKSEDFEEELIDYAEAKFQEKIKDKDTIALIFFLKTKGKKRGWVEKAESNTNPLELAGKAPSWFDDQKTIPEGIDAFEEPEYEMLPDTKKEDKKP